MGVKLCMITVEDYDRLIEIWGDAGLPYRPFGRDSKDKIAKEMAREDTAFIGLYEDDLLVGVGLATFDGRKGWINRVAIIPDYRNKGYASMIIGECEKFLEDCGAEIIACLIEEYNTPSMALFKKHDYLYSEDIHYFSKRKSEET